MRSTAVLAVPNSPHLLPRPECTPANWLRPRFKELHRQDASLAQKVLDLAQMEGPTCIDSADAMSVIALIIKGESHRLDVYLKELQQICEAISLLMNNTPSAPIDLIPRATTILLQKELRELAYKKQKLMGCLYELYDTCHQLRNAAINKDPDPLRSRDLTTTSFLPWHPSRFCEGLPFGRRREPHSQIAEARECEAIAANLKIDTVTGHRFEHKSLTSMTFFLRCPVRPGTFIEVVNQKHHHELLQFFDRHRRNLELDLMPRLTTQINELERLAGRTPRPSPQKKSVTFLKIVS